VKEKGFEVGTRWVSRYSLFADWQRLSKNIISQKYSIQIRAVNSQAKL